MRRFTLIALVLLAGGAAMLLSRKDAASARPTPQEPALLAGQVPAGPDDIGAEDPLVLPAPDAAERADLGTRAQVERGPEANAGTEGPPILSGRLLESDRTPYADAWFFGWIHRGPEVSWGTMIHTDSEGRFMHRIAEHHPLPPAGSSFGAICRSDGLIDRRVDVLLPALAPGALRDLGDLVLEPFAGWIRGSVTDRDGKPWDDVRVELTANDGTLLDGAQVREGSFLIDVRAPEALRAGGRLSARADGWYQREPLTVHTGGIDVEIVLERGGRIEGSLIPSPRFGRAPVAVRARPGVGPPKPQYGVIEEDGQFAIKGLDQGTHVFELAVNLMGGTDAPLIELPDIEVRWNETTRDPRLQNLSLEGFLRTASVRVVDRAALPIRSAFVYVLEQDGRVLSASFGTQDELLELVLPRNRQVDALIFHPRYRPATISPLAEANEVVLEDGIALFLRSSRPIVVDDGRRGGQLVLRPEAPPDGPWIEGVGDVGLPMEFGSGQELEAVFPFPGTFRLHVRVLRRMGTALGMSPGDRYVPIDLVLEVLESDAGSHRELDLPPDLLDLADPRATPR